MHVHVLARVDVARGEADDLVVAAHRLPSRDRAHGELVAGRNGDQRGDSLLGDEGAGRNLQARDHHVVVGVQADGEVGSLQHQWLSLGTKAPLFPTRKSRSAPSCAWSTWSK